MVSVALVVIQPEALNSRHLTPFAVTWTFQPLLYLDWLTPVNHR